MTTFARYLQTKMDELGWNRSQLAKSAGFNRGVVTEYLNNNVIPGKENRGKIAKALGVRLSDVNAAADGSPTHGVFELSPERQADAQALDRSQSELIYEMIRHLAKANRQAQGDDDEETELERADRRNVERRERTPHRPRRAGHDPEWDELYGDYELAAQKGLEGVDPGEVEEQYP